MPLPPPPSSYPTLAASFDAINRLHRPTISLAASIASSALTALCPIRLLRLQRPRVWLWRFAGGMRLWRSSYGAAPRAGSVCKTVACVKGICMPAKGFSVYRCDVEADARE
ncbi:Os02g0292400 [Oryza sativa Japonica Group]|uniref:Os02g0292400 protein n=1 Tax=Oryza sativa subsp. japonica TaxID=39947 RepID=A0A0P0VHU4_ORYSJ|nr:Os02g0292400 [Oryza sativa Japonica Group]